MTPEIENAMDLKVELAKRKEAVETILKMKKEICAMQEDSQIMDPREAFEYALSMIISKVIRIEGVPFRDWEIGVCKDSYK